MIERHPSIDPAHPGEILREDVLPALGVSKTAVAAALGISRQTLYDILNEKQPVTAEMAVRFGKLFGNGPGFWVNLQRNYDLARARNVRWMSAEYRRSKRGAPSRDRSRHVGRPRGGVRLYEQSLIDRRVLDCHSGACRNPYVLPLFVIF